MMHFLYNITFTLFLIVSLPYFFLRSLLDRSFRMEFAHRFGHLPPLPAGRPVWVHAASVGEVLCSVPLIKKMKAEFPDRRVLVTTMTRTGNATARNQVSEADAVLFLPWDHPLILRRVFREVDPALVLIAETELWPNLLRFCGRRKVPLVLFNGRISDRSFPRYRGLRCFFEKLLRSFSLLLMQNEKDRQRMVELGAPPEKTRVTGNIKFDQAFPSLTAEMKTQMAASLGLLGHEKILIAGSTHPGEEEILLGVYRGLVEAFSDLILILCPRHLDRLEQVERLLKRGQWTWVRRTALPRGEPPFHGKEGGRPPVVLLDTMGELTRLYGLGTLVFIGGSLVPVGGHNPLEALGFGTCVLFGPHMFNFREIARLLTEASGAIQVKDGADLLTQAKRLLQEEGARRELGERGRQVLHHHRGATERIADGIRPILREIEDRRL